MKSNKLLSTLLVATALGVWTNARGQWNDADIGAAGQPGSVVTNGDGTLSIIAGGHDIWDTADHSSAGWPK